MNGAVDAISTPDPVATNAENEYGLKVLLDTAVTEPYASEYCCVSFVSSELAEKHPDIAAAFTRAVLKASRVCCGESRGGSADTDRRRVCQRRRQG